MLGAGGTVMDVSGTLGGALVVSIAVSSAVHVWLAWKMETQARAVAVALAEVLPSVRAMGDPSEAIQDVRDEITDTINGVLGAMHVPTAADHLMGTIAAIAQARFLGPLAQAQAALTGEGADLAEDLEV